MAFKTADICDDYADAVQVAQPLFQDYGGHVTFCGPISTIKAFEDNSRVREAVAEPGDGRVLVIDAGGSLRRAMLGDNLAGMAVSNGWAGFVIHGAIRDSVEIATLPIGVKAMGLIPRKTDKQGIGQRDCVIGFSGVTFSPGHWLYADPDGLVVAPHAVVS